MNWLRTHWHVPAVIILLLLAFATGRFTARKPDVKTVEKIVTVEKLVTVEKKADTKVVTVYRDRIVHPDGSSETKTTLVKTDKATTDINATNTATSANAMSTATATPRADWLVHAMVGTPISLMKPSLLVGASVERRILGPIYAGGWLLGGVQTGNFYGGLSLGLVF